MEGTIVKAYGGFYYVKAGEKLWQCSLRGVFKHHKVNVMVGDRVEICPSCENQGVVEKVYPRRNALVRPTVANVDRAVIIMAVRDPEPSLPLLDRLLIHAESESVQPVICFNKIDLDKGKLSEIVSSYNASGYKIVKTCARDGTGIESLKEVVTEGITVFAGPSGVGKSSLLNAIQPGLFLKMGDIGSKLKRGRHTTRHVELIPLDQGGLVADTPGFSNLALTKIKNEELGYYFSEMEKYVRLCKFTGCLHKSEPECAVKDAVNDKKIDSGRYERYLEILDEIIGQERRY